MAHLLAAIRDHRRKGVALFPHIGRASGTGAGRTYLRSTLYQEWQRSVYFESSN